MLYLLAVGTIVIVFKMGNNYRRFRVLTSDKAISHVDALHIAEEIHKAKSIPSLLQAYMFFLAFWVISEFLLFKVTHNWSQALFFPFL